MCGASQTPAARAKPRAAEALGRAERQTLTTALTTSSFALSPADRMVILSARFAPALSPLSALIVITIVFA